MRVTVDIVENGFVATPLVGRGSDERPRVYVAKNVLDLAEVFEGLRLEDELLTGRGEPGVAEYEGLLSSMRGAGLAIVKGEGRREEGESLDAALEELGDVLQDADGWPATLSPEPEPEPAPADEVAYVPAAEDGYEYPAVRGPKNGKREILCPDHGWQRAELKDGAYRCMFKPSPRQVCQQPGTPKALAEKRLVSA